MRHKGDKVLSNVLSKYCTNINVRVIITILQFVLPTHLLQENDSDIRGLACQ
jgi:hypothetical protein